MEKTQLRAVMRGLGGWVKELAVVLLIVMALQVSIVQAYHVPTGSMESTIETGDYLLADKVTLGPRTPQWLGIPWTNIGSPVPALKLPGLRKVEPGDVVVVEVPVDERTPYVKRVVAVGGQTVEVHDKQLYVDGVLVPDPPNAKHIDPYTLPVGFLQPGILNGLGNRDQFEPYVVPEGKVFLMGDNRDNSYDSRYFGPVSESAIIGRARVVTLSWRPEKALPWKRLSLSRFGKLLN